ncbi:MAG TPA: alcohol dehydrogenase catalytic domain-containing protein [Streptosporangiaceae bacterium]|jgi:threonine dehydrogenase-like Zn-dependent dehydrogenase|nr:alcohol dehydrogenase catalytic domain-containing protein [Streptosporangiaceae bacterium]
MRTQALLLDRELTLRTGPLDLPDPGPGEVLVRVEWAGVCGSDLHVLRTGDWVSYWPATLGHEVAGTVEHCPGGELPTGTLVVIDSRVPCGNCAGCAAGPNRCERLAWVGEAHPGGFAGHLVLPVSRVVPGPASLEPAVAVLAEPLAVALHAARRVPRHPERVAILGYGPIGALVHLALTADPSGLPEVTVVEPARPRRELAAALGARVATREDLAARSVAQRPQLVVDAAGYPGSLADAVALTATGGTVLAVALGHEEARLLPAEIAERELTITGSIGFATELPEAVAALDRDPDRYRPVVTEAVPLEDAPGRLRELLTAPSSGKVLIRP